MNRAPSFAYYIILLTKQKFLTYKMQVTQHQGHNIVCLLLLPNVLCSSHFSKVSNLIQILHRWPFYHLGHLGDVWNQLSHWIWILNHFLVLICPVHYKCFDPKVPPPINQCIHCLAFYWFVIDVVDMMLEDMLCPQLFVCYVFVCIGHWRWWCCCGVFIIEIYLCCSFCCV